MPNKNSKKPLMTESDWKQLAKRMGVSVETAKAMSEEGLSLVTEVPTEGKSNNLSIPSTPPVSMSPSYPKKK